MAAKKKPIFYDTLDLVTVRQCTYNGISVLVQIDRLNNKISFVERKPDGTYKPKAWKFAERGVQYMNGWRNILKAMDLAAVDAQADLEAYQKIQSEKATQDMVAMHVALDKMKAPR